MPPERGYFQKMILRVGLQNVESLKNFLGLLIRWGADTSNRSPYVTGWGFWRISEFWWGPKYSGTNWDSPKWISGSLSMFPGVALCQVRTCQSPCGALQLRNIEVNRLQQLVIALSNRERLS
jgi:hypothetical protein